MSIEQIAQWRLTCDAEGCASDVMSGDSADAAVVVARDLGWQVTETGDEAYCPRHVESHAG